MEDSRGRLTPEQVVDAARSSKSALHKCFTWDDSEAAHKWRIDEARELIRSVRIEVVVEDRPIRSIVYVRDPEQPSGTQGYVAWMRVRKKDTADVLREELTGIVELCGRALNIICARESDYRDVKIKVEKVKSQVERIIDGV